MTQTLRRTERIQTGPNGILIIDSPGALRVPYGGSFSRPEEPEPGMIRFNKDIKRLEHFDGEDWISFIDRQDDFTMGDLQVNGEFSVSGVSNFGTNSNFSGNACFKNDVQINNRLTVDKKIIGNDALEVSGSASIGQNLIIRNNAEILGGLEIKATLSVDDVANLKNDVQIGQTLSVERDISSEKNLFIKENAQIFGNFNVSGDAVLSNLNASNTTLASLAVSGDANIDEKLTVGNTLTVSNQTTLSNVEADNLNLAQDLTVNGSAEIWLDSTFHKDLYVGHNIVVAGNLEVQGEQVIHNTTVTEIEDNLIVLNREETGAGVSEGTSGIEIDRGSLSPVRWIWDESGKFWGPEGTRFLGNIDTIYALNIENVLTIDAVGGLRIPNGTTAERPNITPAASMAGMIRLNKDTDALEYFNGTDWIVIANSPGVSAFVVRSGDVMTGPLELPGPPSTPLQAATKGYVDSKPSAYRMGFTNSDLLSNILFVTHNLGQQFVDWKLYNNLDVSVNPSDVMVTVTTANNLEIDFSAVAPISGVWNLVVIG